MTDLKVKIGSSLFVLFFFQFQIYRSYLYGIHSTKDKTTKEHDTLSWPIALPKAKLIMFVRCVQFYETLCQIRFPHIECNVEINKIQYALMNSHNTRNIIVQCILNL